ncbi:hypothetical protein BJ322DRAFT_1041768 [Thelephora terrestris]|uniref:Uncharacterized protein n=1 Tax=Thelephora terrestris TaxID=56493 RepID=A0A9P6HKH0_9AGAM|nr:hypothetical protein BJ322DRAFT_1041768 [Thelephora terrestris]
MRGEMADNRNDDGTISRSSTSPPLTGTRTLRLTLGMKHSTLRLLGLPSFLRFRKLECTWYCTNDLRRTKAVMEVCSDTLEFVDIKFASALGSPRAGPVNFPKAIKLKEVVFRLGRIIDVWTVLALETLTSNHRALEKVAIHIHVWTPLVDEAAGSMEGMRGVIHHQWMHLDRILVRLWESHAVSTQVIYSTRGTKNGRLEYIGGLLPEVMKRGMVEVVDHRDV